MKETNIMKTIQLALGSIKGVRLFRNNSGSAWIGKHYRATKREQVWINPGDVVVLQARFFTAGLCVGSSDLIGMKSLIVTPEMVGKPIAVFTSVEVKTSAGKASKEQVSFTQMVNNLGGIGMIVTDENEALEILNKKP